jgi:hypothetical protein
MCASARNNLLILTLFIGCSPTLELREEPPVVDHSLLFEAREEVYQQTGRRFERAEFFRRIPIRFRVSCVGCRR